MQTKSSYRVLKWTFMIGAAASLATACVVTSGDGSDGTLGDGGEGGTTTTAGKTSTAGGGSTSTAGKTSTGGGGSTSTAGTTAAGGDGGAASGYVPGLCEVDAPTPSMLPSCDLNAGDDKDACRKCLKTSCCTEWQTCYGDTPTTACGWGVTAEADGQFDCIHNCYMDNIAASGDVEMVLGDCEGMCLNQCKDKDTDGFALTDTQALLGCGQDSCLAACFPTQ